MSFGKSLLAKGPILVYQNKNKSHFANICDSQRSRNAWDFQDWFSSRFTFWASKLIDQSFTYKATKIGGTLAATKEEEAMIQAEKQVNHMKL